MVERLGILSVRPKLRDMQWSVEIYNSIKDEMFFSDTYLWPKYIFL